MDSLDVVNFQEGFEFGLEVTLPLFGSLVILGILIYCVKKSFRI